MQTDSQVIKKRMLELIYENSGITDSQFRDELTRSIGHQLREEQRVDFLKELMGQGFLKVSKNKSGDLIYGYQDPEEARRLEKLDTNDKIVYQLIADAKGKGLSKIDLKNRSGMNQKLLGTCIKMLEKHGLIKSEKAKDKNRWVFFAHDQEPDPDIVGGNFYINGEINNSKIDILRQKIIGLVQAKDKVSYSEIAKYLVDNAEEARDLKEQDIQSIVSTLVLDDCIEDCSLVGMCEYTISKNVLRSENTGFTSTPCMTCPVFNECHTGGPISPETCIYFEEW